MILIEQIMNYSSNTDLFLTILCPPFTIYGGGGGSFSLVCYIIIENLYLFGL